MEKPKVAIRECGGNPDHYLYDNNGTWFVHYTLHLPDYTKKRVRHSLKTKCVVAARARRDAMLARLRFASRVGQNVALQLTA